MSDSHTILIVEDEALVAMELEMELTDRGLGVVGPATRVDGAIALLDEATVDGAILDVMLGRDEVFPVADRLSERGIPFVFHSGHVDRKAIENRYAAPVYLKPTMADTLVESLMGLIGEG